MILYRLYFCDADNQVTEPPQILLCSNDDEAVRRAEDLRSQGACEIWAGERRVGDLDCKAEAQSKCATCA